MIHFITYTNNLMTISAAKCIEAAQRFIPECSTRIFREDDLNADFVWNNLNIINAERGGGYWLWKPYIIDVALSEAKPNDLIIYSDAGVELIHSVEPLLNQMDEDIYFFGNRWIHGNWCKRDVLIKMGADTPKIRALEQLQASVLIIRKNHNTINFVREWLDWCETPNMIDDSPSKAINLQGFREHRHDQAILTNLARLQDFTFHWYPCKWNQRYKGLYPNDSNELIFFHHRRRNAEWDLETQTKYLS